MTDVPTNLDEKSLEAAEAAVRSQAAWCPRITDIPKYELQTLLSIAIRTYLGAGSSSTPPTPKPLSKAAPKRRSIKGKVLRRDNYTCYLCCKPIGPGEESIDHVIPKSKGGPNRMSNFRAAHRDCNFRKADLSLEEYRTLYPTGEP